MGVSYQLFFEVFLPAQRITFLHPDFLSLAKSSLSQPAVFLTSQLRAAFLSAFGVFVNFHINLRIHFPLNPFELKSLTQCYRNTAFVPYHVYTIMFNHVLQ